ncbi:MAG: tyrosine-type recombinase/integrase [Pirellula sp.]|jgi:integrase|nr:tyrosine-type recombinase/integrase [Pirellula sp.]
MTVEDSTPIVSAGKPNSKSAKRKPSTPATTPAKKERVKPEKPYKDFPLFPHDGKQWAKKVRGKLFYFGSWDNPIAARDKWLREKDDLLAGRTPRAFDPNAMTVKQLCDLFCESKEGKVATGEITQRTFEDYKLSAVEVAKHLGKSAAVEQLRPDDFRKLRSKLAEGVGLKTLDGKVTRARAIFNHASKNGWLETNLNKLWGTEFDKPAKAAISKQDSDTEQLFTREEIIALLELASDEMKAMILLGINGGYGNTDCALIDQSDIADGWLTRRRQKTGKRRRTPLWPETLAAIANVVKTRPGHKDDNNADKLFITKYGNDWIPTAKANPVSQEFAKLVKDAKITGKGKSFYTLRHTFQTIGDETKDFVAVSALMGHVDSTISGHYRERISDERLQAVTEHVHDWLFPPAPKAKKATKKSKGGAK